MKPLWDLQIKLAYLFEDWLLASKVEEELFDEILADPKEVRQGLQLVCKMAKELERKKSSKGEPVVESCCCGFWSKALLLGGVLHL